MTNREKYSEQIIDIAINGALAVKKETGKPCKCNEIQCAECIGHFFEECREQIKEWSEQEYVEPTVDWSKVPVDTKILVRSRENEKWLKRHFAMYKNGSVYAFTVGATSYSANGSHDVSCWHFAKLAEEDV